MCKLTRLLAYAILILSNILFLPAPVVGQNPAGSTNGWLIYSIDQVDPDNVVH